MGLNCRVIQTADLQELLDYENRKLADLVSDENERALQAWNARWRREALEHHIPMGWSFMARDKDVADSSGEGQLVGYFIAQPFLFMDGQTQTLWVEHLAYSSLKSRDELCELAYKLCREKHFQRVLFPNVSGIANSVAAFKAETWQSSVLCVKTTKV